MKFLPCLHPSSPPCTLLNRKNGAPSPLLCWYDCIPENIFVSYFLVLPTSLGPWWLCQVCHQRSRRRGRTKNAKGLLGSNIGEDKRGRKQNCTGAQTTMHIRGSFGQPDGEFQNKDCSLEEFVLKRNVQASQLLCAQPLAGGCPRKGEAGSKALTGCRLTALLTVQQQAFLGGRPRAPPTLPQWWEGC